MVVVVEEWVQLRVWQENASVRSEAAGSESATQEVKASYTSSLRPHSSVRPHTLEA